MTKAIKRNAATEVPPTKKIRVLFGHNGNFSLTFNASNWTTSEHTLRVYRAIRELPPVDGQKQYEFETLAEFREWSRVFIEEEAE